MVRGHDRDQSVEGDVDGCSGGGIDGATKDFEQRTNISCLGGDFLGEEGGGSLGEEARTKLYNQACPTREGCGC